MALIDDVGTALSTPISKADLIAAFETFIAADWTGAAGADGQDGTNGTNGTDGDSAYEVAVANGFVGTEQEWLDSLQGEPGADGSGASLSDVYPVGCIYTTTVSTNPATVFGFGTWSAFGAGRVLVGLDSGDSDFNTVEETGGSKTHTLTGAQSGTSVHNHATTGLLRSSTSGGATTLVTQSSDTSSTAAAFNVANSSAANAAEAHPIVQPYIVVYFFKRTA